VCVNGFFFLCSLGCGEAAVVILVTCFYKISEKSSPMLRFIRALKFFDNGNRRCLTALGEKFLYLYQSDDKLRVKNLVRSNETGDVAIIAVVGSYRRGLYSVGVPRQT
jgi:hypothetical protein